MLNIIAVSMSSQNGYLRNPMTLIPIDFSFSAYAYVLTKPLILTSYANTIITTLLGTVLSLVLLTAFSYPLSKDAFRGKKVLMNLVIFTMMFHGGIIPNYYLVRSLGMVDTLWALIVPGSFAAFNCILIINYMRSLPPSLVEAARLDGANELQTLWYVILPLCKPILATIGLFCAVGRWNSYFNAVLYIQDRAKWTLQLTLREIVMISNSAVLEGDMDMMRTLPQQGVKYATIVVAAIPVICIYPFLQKYFIKGIMIGAVKG